MGATRWITTSGTSLALTRFPAWTSKLPVRPDRGERIWPSLRLGLGEHAAERSLSRAALAHSMPACVARADSRATSALVLAWSDWERETTPALASLA